MKIAPILISMVVLASAMLGLIVLSSSPAAAAGTTRYFIGNDAGCNDRWESANCWSLTSGGAGGAGQPTINDDAIFDTNSGGVLVFVNVPTTAHDLIYRDGSNNGIIMDADSPTVVGSLTLAGSLTDVVGQNPPSTFFIQMQYEGTAPLRPTLKFGGNLHGLPGGGLQIAGTDQFNVRVIATKPGAVAHGVSGTNFDSTRGCTIDATDGSNSISNVQNWDETPPYHNVPGENCIFPAAPAVVSGTLYGCSAEFNDWFSMLYTIDLGTAVAHPVGFLHDSNGGYFTKCSSLIVKDGRMYTWARPFCPFPDICTISPDLFYYRVDPSNAQVTQIVDAGPGSVSVTDMALRSDGTGFMLRQGSGATTLCAPGGALRLCSMNVETGVTAQVGAVTPAEGGNAIEFNAQGVLDFATKESGITKLFSLSTTTAATTFIANIPNQVICAAGSEGNPVNAMALAVNGQMFASLNCGTESRLTILDTSTGTQTDVGEVMMDYGTYTDTLPTASMDGLAFYTIAPPTTQLPPPPPPAAYVPPSSADIVAGAELALAGIIVLGLAVILVFRPQGRVRKWTWIIVGLAALALVLIYFAPAFFNF